MTKTRTYLLGAASVIPPITLPACMVGLFFALKPDPVRVGAVDGPLDMGTQAAVFVSTVALPALFLLSAVVFATVGLFYLIHAARNERDRTLWLVMLLCIPIVAVPAYWVLKIRNRAGTVEIPAPPG